MTSSPPDLRPEPGFGVYVHVPFCARACPYCDFDFRVDPRPDGAALVEAFAREVEGREDVRRGQSAHTIYVGGGTPSVLCAKDLGELLGFIAQTWDSSRCVEWTVEFNPEHVDEARLGALVLAGATRISLGVQSFDPTGLRQLGRAHDPEKAARAVTLAHGAGLEVSVDLIVGWPGQTMEGLQAELDQVLALPANHVSVYALTIEPGTPWERLAQRGVRRLPQADDAADALEHCAATLEAAGF